MSTLKVNTIQDTTGDNALTFDSSGNTTIVQKLASVNGNKFPSAGALSHRNILINGDFRISQRNGTTALAMTDNLYNIDRWAFVGASSRITTQQVEDGPPGFKYCMKAVSVGANTPDAADALWYKLEGYDVAPLAYGTSDAKTTTLSFWFKASASGTYGGAIQKHDLARSCPFSFTVSSADTWEYKSVTIPGDTTSSTYRDTNLFSVSIKFSTGCASGYLDTAGTWVGSDKRGASSTTQIQATNTAYFSVTGIQWEIGETATSYEHKSYAEELARCKRYFQMLASGADGTENAFANAVCYSSSAAYGAIRLDPEMRAKPSAYQVNGTNYWRAATSGSKLDEFDNMGVQGGNFDSQKSVEFTCGGNLSVTTDDPAWIRVNNSAARYGVDAEL